VRSGVQPNFDFSIMNTTYGQLPNQYTPMAFLPPDMAKLILYDIYATMGSLAVGLSSLLPSHKNKPLRYLGVSVGHSSAYASRL